MSKIVLVGGSGYLGSVVLPLLQSEGYDVVVFDKFHYGSAHLTTLLPLAKQWAVGDVRDYDSLKKVSRGATYIINLAAVVGSPVCARFGFEARSVNVDGAKVVASVARDSGIRVVHASTGTAYGPVQGECSESSPISPATVYGEQKALSEAYLTDLNGCSLRFSTVFGLSPRLRNDLLIHSLCMKASRDRSVVLYESNALRSFVHVNDAARAICHLMSSQQAQGPFNIADPAMCITKGELCQLIQTIAGEFTVSNMDYSEDLDCRNYLVSSRRLLDTGFLFDSSFDEAIKNVFDFYKLSFDSSMENG